MCGVAGIFDRSGRRPPSPEELRQMVGALRHRGPDEQGLFHDEQAGLGHARLSIIDPEGGHQPIHNEDRTVWVVLNGEVFNYLELRRELVERGHAFYTRSDTEVLVHLYEEHGDAFVERLNGQFAIALWDTRERRLLLARDRVGIRPLHLTEAGGRVLFAAEVTGLFRLPEVERRLDPAALGQLFTWWSVLPPRSVFAGVETLPPGSVTVIDGAGRRTRRYWDASFPTSEAGYDARPLPELVDELRALLTDAVRLRLRADVPVGAYLSGGLDSAVITALVGRCTDVPLRTFSLGFEDAEFDERPYQRALVAHLNTAHSELVCTRRAIRELFPRTILHTESPVLRTAPTPLLALSGAVRDAGFKVVLTGEGADEVFGGYDLFREARARRMWAADPDGQEPLRLLRSLYPYLEASPTANAAFARRFFRQDMDRVGEPFFGHLPRWRTTARSWRFFSPELRDCLSGFDRYEVVREALPADISSWAPLCRDQYVEVLTLMSGYLLSSQGDRVMMANSVEGRFPFLDHRVLEWAARLPVDAKIRGGEEKYILKRATEDLVPREIVARPKQPYRAPDSASFFEDGEPAPYVAELLSSERLTGAGYFDPAAVARLMSKCASGRAIGFADNMAFVGILSTMLLDETLVRGVEWN